MNRDKHCITFVCTDNFGRSVIAEYCLRYYCQKNDVRDVKVASAGIYAYSDTSQFSLAHYNELKRFGIDASNHIRRQLDDSVLKGSDILVAMDIFHQKFIKDKYGIDAPLFNEIYKGKHSSIIVHNKDNNFDIDLRMRDITNLIYNSMPTFYSNLLGLLKK